MTTRIKNATLVLADRCLIGDLDITGERISAVHPDHAESPPDQIIQAKGTYLLPAFIDLHSNGIAGFDFTNGWFMNGRFSNEEADYHHGLEQAAAAYAASGVSRALLTSLAAPIDTLQRVFALYSAYRSSNQASFLVKNILAGIYVEGTFIKNTAFRGAHNDDYFCTPTIELFDSLRAFSRDQIRIVNVPPEWGARGETLIHHMSEQGVIPAAGHTGASGLDYEQAIEHGVRLAIHLFNGPTGSSFKPFLHGGAVEAILRSQELWAELIVDGYHVDPGYVLDAVRRKGSHRIVAVTDNMFAAGLKDLTEFMILGVHGEVSENRRYLQVKGRSDTLCGSVLTMDQAFANLLTWFTQDYPGIWYEKHEALSLPDALIKAATLCSTNPATLLGLNQTGTIAVGKLADLLLVDIQQTDLAYQVTVNKVFIKGKQVI